MCHSAKKKHGTFFGTEFCRNFGESQIISRSLFFRKSLYFEESSPFSTSRRKKEKRKRKRDKLKKFHAFEKKVKHNYWVDILYKIGWKNVGWLVAWKVTPPPAWVVRGRSKQPSRHWTTTPGRRATRTATSYQQSAATLSNSCSREELLKSMFIRTPT